MPGLLTTCAFGQRKQITKVDLASTLLVDSVRLLPRVQQALADSDESTVHPGASYTDSNTVQVINNDTVIFHEDTSFSL